MTLFDYIKNSVEMRGGRKGIFSMNVEEGQTTVEFIESVKKLREAQKTYMANRGNEVYGKLVAEAAEQVDKFLAKVID